MQPENRAYSSTMTPRLVTTIQSRPRRWIASTRPAPGMVWPSATSWMTPFRPSTQATPSFHFCGQRPEIGLPYCAVHARIAYQPTHDRRRDRRLVNLQ